MANYNTIAEFEAALKRAKEGLNTALESAVRKSVPSLAESIKLRISTTGKAGDGSSFSTPYSRSHAYKRKKYGKGSLGTQTGYKGFFYKGTMWDNFKMLAVKASGANVTATLGFTGSNVYTSNELLNQYHSTNEGGKPIARPNNEESKELVKKIGFEIGEYLKSVL